MPKLNLPRLTYSHMSLGNVVLNGSGKWVGAGVCIEVVFMWVGQTQTDSMEEIV